jgi:hypothetical protein
MEVDDCLRRPAVPPGRGESTNPLTAKKTPATRKSANAGGRNDEMMNDERSAHEKPSTFESSRVRAVQTPF